jgi:Protein of unknown function (DUF4065)
MKDHFLRLQISN